MGIVKILNHSGMRPTANSARPRVTLLTTQGCHLCEDAQAELLERAARGQVSLEVVPADSERAVDLMALHRPAMFPLVLINGESFSTGRLPRRKLDRVLSANGAV